MICVASTKACAWLKTRIHHKALKYNPPAFSAYLDQRAFKTSDDMCRCIRKGLQRKRRVPELAAVVALHFHAILGYIEIVVYAGEMRLELRARRASSEEGRQHVHGLIHRSNVDVVRLLVFSLRRKARVKPIRDYCPATRREGLTSMYSSANVVPRERSQLKRGRGAYHS